MKQNGEGHLQREAGEGVGEAEEASHEGEGKRKQQQQQQAHDVCLGFCQWKREGGRVAA